MKLCYQIRWRKEGRYYKVVLQKDLLGDWSLTKIWGGINSRLGNYQNHTFLNLKDAFNMINEIKIRREKRGYVCHEL
jgi:predicted DNA-binding WGR domain protein